jgi:hypothetical protein
MTRHVRHHDGGVADTEEIEEGGHAFAFVSALPDPQAGPFELQQCVHHVLLQEVSCNGYASKETAWLFVGETARRWPPEARNPPCCKTFAGWRANTFHQRLPVGTLE